MKLTTDYMEVAERLYYHANPETKMDVPNSVYEMTERWWRQWLAEDTEKPLFDWVLENKK